MILLNVKKSYTLILFGMYASVAQAQYTSINANKLQLNEPSVAINKTNLNEIIVGANTDVKLLKNESHDWHMRNFTSKYGVYGDPVLYCDKNGTLYFAHLSKTAGKEWGAWFDRIVIDVYKNFNDTIPFRSYGIGLNGTKMQDKPWLTVDETSGKNHGTVYVTWTEFDVYGSANPEHNSRIQFAALRNGDTAFSNPVTLSTVLGDCKDSDSTLEGATCAVDKLGNLHVVWSGLNKIWYTHSQNAGASWAEAEIIAAHKNGWNLDIPNIMRANGMPFIVADTVADRLYVTWAQQEGEHGEVMVISTGKSRQWSIAESITPLNSRQKFFPFPKIDQQSGKLLVAYYDQRNSSTGFFYDVFITVLDSNNIQETFLINSRPIGMPGKSFFYGDYLGLDIHNQKGVLVYSTYEGFGSGLTVFQFNPTKLKNISRIDKSTLLVFQQNYSKTSIGYKANRRSKIKIKFYDKMESDSLSGLLKCVVPRSNKLREGELMTFERAKYQKIEYSIKERFFKRSKSMILSTVN